MSQRVWGEPFQSVFPTATPTSNFPSCHSTVTHGENVASNVSPPTERGITCNHFNAAYICFSSANSGSYFLLDLPRSSCKISVLGGLVIRVDAKLLYLTECQVPRVETCVTIFESPLRLGVSAEGTCVFASSRNSVPIVLACGSFRAWVFNTWVLAFLSVLRRSITFLLHSA